MEKGTEERFGRADAYRIWKGAQDEKLKAMNRKRERNEFSTSSDDQRCLFCFLFARHIAGERRSE
jgi:hypothetical protein